MGTQTSKCVCCKCKDCKCKIITQRNGGRWAPPPTVVCNKNFVHGRFLFEDSCDCQGYNCQRQEGCTVSKICLSHTYRIKVRVWGQLEALRSGFHKGTIEYRKISCSKREGWKTLVEISSEAEGKPCCVKCVKKVCEIKLARGKYEFRFKADSIDGKDHCNNYLQYDMKWCRITSPCPPVLRPEPGCNSLCCSTANCPDCHRRSNKACVPCPDRTQFNVVPCDSISLA
jgi:hypothetical protein